jgi:hypothetical protein
MARRRDERGEIGPDLFRAAFQMGLEGLVSKHRERRRGKGLDQDQELLASGDGARRRR